MNSVTTIEPNKLSVPVLHGYLLAAVAPRPIALASTIDNKGRVNLSPFSFFNVFSANPPIMIFSPARRGTNNTIKHTLQNALSVPEVVINVVTHGMVEQVSLASTEYADGVNEFEKAGFTEIPSESIKPPRVGESPVAFECKVNEVVHLGTEGGAGNLVIAEVLRIHIKSKYLDQKGILQTNKLDLVGRMGGNWYCRATGNALFQISKPGASQGIGIDQLPASIRNSEVLTGNNLGKLGGLHQLPMAAEIEQWRQKSNIKAMMKDPDAYRRLHILAQAMIGEGRIMEGCLTLLVAHELPS